jgi:hypothetical protein
METMTVEVGIEQVWSDSDALSQDGYGAVPHDVAVRPSSALREAISLAAVFERLWSDGDSLQVAKSLGTLKIAA